jgi:autotransporter-associated beta strand protein
MKMILRNSILEPWCSPALKPAALGVMFVIAAAVPLPAAQLTLKHNVTQQVGGGVYQGVTDSWMEYHNTLNFGADPDLYVGEYDQGVGDSIVIKFVLPAVTCQSIQSATQSLWYVDTYGMGYNNTALLIEARRINPGYSWYENTGGGGGGRGGGLDNHGVNYRYRDANDTLLWNPSVYDAGYYETTYDGSGTNWIKRTGGTVTNALAPQQWVPFNVQPSVAQWYAGQENNGLGFYVQGNVGSDNTAAGDFASKENTDYGPTLVITYAGAQIAWTGASSSTWDAASLNWNVGGYFGIYGDGDFVTFADGASNPGISVAGGGVSPGSVTITNTSTTYSFSGGSISGSGGLTKQGGGTATLSASNGYSGLTLVQAGGLIVAANNALGAVGSGTVVSNGAALGFQGGVNYSTAEPVTISGGGGGGGGALYAVSGSNTFAGPVTLAADSTLGVTSGLGLALNGAISGGFNLTKTGQGTLSFGGGAANSYGGTTYVTQGTLALAKSSGTAVPNNLVVGDGINAVTVRLDAAGQLCPGCCVTVRETSLFDLNNFNSTVGGLTLSGGTAASGAGTLTLNGNVAGIGNTSATISGNLNLGGGQREIQVTNGAASDDLVISATVTNGGIEKTGTGRLVLSGNNTFDGNVVVSNGVVAVAASSALGSSVGGTTVSNTARLELRNNVAVANEGLTLNGSGGGLGALDNFSDTNSWGGSITLASNAMIECDGGLLSLGNTVAAAGFALTFNTTGDITVNGSITGSGTALTKNGGGRLTLAGAGSTYSGATLINQGTLALSASGAIPNSPVIDVTAGATFDVSAVTGGFILGAAGNQTLQGSGTVNGNVATTGLVCLAPGDGVGTLTFLNNLSLAAGVTNYFELTNSFTIGGGTNDLIVVGGGLTLNSNVIAITVLGPNPLGVGSYRLFNYAGAKTGSFNPTPVFLSGSPVPGEVAIDESITNQINLVIVAAVSTTTMATSSRNPSLPGSNVTFTATVSAVPPATNVPTGTVTFKTNDVPMGLPVALSNGAASISTTLLPHGFTTVKAEYPAQGLFLGSTGSVVQLVNTPPTPGYHVAYVMQNEPLVLPVATLLSNDYDPDHDSLTIIAVSQLSTNGGTAALVYGTNITYLPKPDYIGNDLLTYTLSDSYTNVSVPIYISVLSYSALTNSLVGITNLGGGTVRITSAGIPGRTYRMLAATNLLTPILYWTTLSTNVADTNGLWQCTDPGATNTEGFYRTVTQTNPPDFSLFDAELLSLNISNGGLPPTMMIRESPTLQSLGVTRIRPLTNGTFTICSFFDVFTEVSMNGGLTWFPATNGPIPLILVGGTPPNGFSTDSLPPLGGQYITPPGWTEFYLQLAGPGIAISNITLYSFTMAFPPPLPGKSSTNNFGAQTDLFVSRDGGHTFSFFTAPAQVRMRITGRP